MVAYIKQLIRDLIPIADRQHPDVYCLYNAIATEVNRLDPRDFAPAVQRDFALTRARLEWASGDVTRSRWVIGNLEPLLQILDQYRGEGSHSTTREFPFVSDNDLKEIITRDYRELSQVVFPANAWKSAVVLAGSILEAILQDQLTKDERTLAAANQSPSAPRGKELAKGEWSLQYMITVCVELGILTEERADCVDQVLRDYRNFVHPKKEVKSAHPCTEAEGFLAVGALDAVCNHLEGRR